MKLGLTLNLPTEVEVYAKINNDFVKYAKFISFMSTFSRFCRRWRCPGGFYSPNTPVERGLQIENGLNLDWIMLDIIVFWYNMQHWQNLMNQSRENGYIPSIWAILAPFGPNFILCVTDRRTNGRTHRQTELHRTHWVGRVGQKRIGTAPEMDKIDPQAWTHMNGSEVIEPSRRGGSKIALQLNSFLKYNRSWDCKSIIQDWII